MSIKINEITYSIGRTIQIAPYTPLNFHASVKAEVKGDIPTAFAELKKIVETQINSDIDKVVNPPVVKKPRQVNKFKGMLDGFDPFGNPLQK